jgi:hypothetical protein
MGVLSCGQERSKPGFLEIARNPARGGVYKKPRFADCCHSSPLHKRLVVSG